MNPWARRSPRVLLVAAVSTTAWVGSTSGASALMRCDPTISDCPDEVSSFTTVMSPHVTIVRTVTEKTIIRNSVVDKSLIVRERTRTVEFDPHVVLMPDGTTRWCDDLTAAEGATEPAAKPAAKTVEPTTVEPTTAERSARVTTAAVQKAHKLQTAPKPKAVTTTSAATSAPAPSAVVTEALPRTGGNGAALTMLGLALIASGAAMRTVARD